ncbi:MAG: phosphoribosylamine--glycine ligase [Acidobacteria bacterium]|nr:phosphoribosylamine--glycine ligase [Acidobacteriota bacterium]
MRVMLIGSGGREHALLWALRHSPEVTEVYAATKNAGILGHSKPAKVGSGTPAEVADFAAAAQIDLVVIGPEQPLVDGLADTLAERGIPAFGPRRNAARLEGSKVFAKEFMARHNIPTARSLTVVTPDEALEALNSGNFGFPVVIKAEGLAAGKGVIIAADQVQARTAITDLMVDQKLGEAGRRLIIEECLTGRELSYLVFSDGRDYVPMPVAQDHKRALDGDRGPNTGGMGAYSTSGLLDPGLEAIVRQTIVEPTLAAAQAEGFPFRGVLYTGLMLTAEGPKVLEYNVRLGDPETQAILRRLDSSFAEIAFSVSVGSLASIRPVWSDDSSTCIVLASEGYPGNYRTGRAISGIEAADSIPGVAVFHAGTITSPDGKLVTAGGRVLGVTSRASSLDQATNLAYEAVKLINFEGIYYRHDIGRV